MTHSTICTKYHSMFHTFISDQQFTNRQIQNQLFPMMTTTHQRNQNVSKNDDTPSKSTQNSPPQALPGKYITDRLTNPLIPSLPILLIPPIHEQVTVRKSNVPLSLMTNHSSMNRIFHIQFQFKISCVKYIPLLCRIWPDLTQKSPLFYQQSLGMIQTHAPNSQLSLMTRLEPQFSQPHTLFRKTVCQFPQFTINTVFPLSNVAQRLSFRFFS